MGVPHHGNHGHSLGHQRLLCARAPTGQPRDAGRARSGTGRVRRRTAHLAVGGIRTAQEDQVVLLLPHRHGGHRLRHLHHHHLHQPPSRGALRAERVRAGRIRVADCAAWLRGRRGVGQAGRRPVQGAPLSGHGLHRRSRRHLRRYPGGGDMDAHGLVARDIPGRLQCLCPGRLRHLARCDRLGHPLPAQVPGHRASGHLHVLVRGVSGCSNHRHAQRCSR